MIRVISLLAVSLLVVAGMLAMRRGGDSESQPNAGTAEMRRRILPVETMTVTLADSYPSQHNYLGEVVARSSSELGFERMGRLVTMDINEGETFQQGEILARLDTDRLLEQRQELLAQTEAIKARLDELVAGARTETISAAESTVKDLTHQVELANRNLERREKLVAEAMAAREDLDAAKFGAQSVAARLDSAKHQLDELKSGTREEVIRAQRASLQRSESLLAQNQIEIDRSVIRAPYDCTVTTQMADVGQVVSPGAQILSVIANTAPEVWIGVPVSEIEALQPGCTFPVAINGRQHHSVVKNVVPQLDPSTRTMTAILALPDATIAAVPIGQTARLALERSISERGCWIPVAALIKGTRGLWSCLRLIEGEPEFEHDQPDGSMLGRLERCDVEILHSDGDRVFVRSTLDDGDLVVHGGANRAAPNQWAYVVAQADRETP